jgi:hypothetical protein
MPQASITHLDEYKDACEKLRDEIELAIQDYKFREMGGNIWYAVDFSEIYSYILPAESFQDFIIFPDVSNDREEIANATALQQLVLRHIFYDLSPEHKLILLPSYLLEFRTFIRSLQQREFLNLVEESARIFNDLEKIIEKGFGKEVEAIFQKIEVEESYVASNEEEDTIAKFVQEYGYIYSFLTGGQNGSHPFSRVKELRPEAVFSRLGDLVSLPQPISSEVYDRWVEELLALRDSSDRISSTELDAAAMNLIYEANQGLHANTRLLLITRSWFMHKLYQREYKEGLWKNAGNYPLLRHPRVISIMLVVASKSSTDDLQDLLHLKETIGLFLDGYVARNINRRNNDQELLHLIDEVKRDWKRIQMATLAPEVISPDVDLDTKLKNSKHAREILKLARDNQSIRNRIINILDELFYQLDVNQDVLGLALQLPENLRDGQDSDTFVIRPSFLFTPHKIKLHTSTWKDVMNELAQESEVRTREIINLFKKGFKPDGSGEREAEDYDRNLVMAYLLGLLNKWQIAENYCLRAKKIGGIAGLSINEALYFQAICRRDAQLSQAEKTVTEDWLIEILNLLDTAIADSISQVSADHIIARYQVEKGISILQFHKKYGKPSDKVPTATDALRILEEWDERLSDNLPLRLFLLGMELDFLIAEKRFRELSRIKVKFTSLEHQLLQFENDNSKWPSYVVDVMTWGKWVCFPEKFGDEKTRRKLTKQLRAAMEKEPLRQIRSELYHHLKRLEKDEPY